MNYNNTTRTLSFLISLLSVALSRDWSETESMAKATQELKVGSTQSESIQDTTLKSHHSVLNFSCGVAPQLKSSPVNTTHQCGQLHICIELQGCISNDDFIQINKSIEEH